MRFVLRADASSTIGSGHVMRLLALAEELLYRAHEVILVGDISNIQWLDMHVKRAGVSRLACEPNELNITTLLNCNPDVVVIDGYQFDPLKVAKLTSQDLPVVAFIDGDTRGLEVDLYIDHNLSAEESVLAGTLGHRFLGGSRFALVRREIREARIARDNWVKRPRKRGSPIRVVCVLGGTDPNANAVTLVRMLSQLDLFMDISVIAPKEEHQTILDIPLNRHSKIRVLAPTVSLPNLVAQCDVAICAVGITAWEMLTIGIPTAFIRVARNQDRGYEAIRAHDLGICLGNISDLGEDPVSAARTLSEGWTNRVYLSQLSKRGTMEFDGLGSSRISKHLERMQNIV